MGIEVFLTMTVSWAQILLGLTWHFIYAYCFMLNLVWVYCSLMFELFGGDLTTGGNWFFRSHPKNAEVGGMPIVECVCVGGCPVV